MSEFVKIKNLSGDHFKGVFESLYSFKFGGEEYYSDGILTVNKRVCALVRPTQLEEIETSNKDTLKSILEVGLRGDDFYALRYIGWLEYRLFRPYYFSGLDVTVAISDRYFDLYNLPDCQFCIHKNYKMTDPIYIFLDMHRPVFVGFVMPLKHHAVSPAAEEVRKDWVRCWKEMVEVTHG